MSDKQVMEDVETPTTFCHLDGYPPLPGENLKQYLERVNPMLDAKVREKERQEAWPHNWPLWLLLVAIAIASTTSIYFGG